MMADDDIVEDNILTRSDVKDLVRWKSVCKSWNSFISSPYFVEAHLKHHHHHHKTNTRIAMPSYWKIPNDEDDKLYQSNVWKLVGSSNGLVCVSFIRVYEKVDHIILLINPRTREVRELPMPTLPPNGTTDISLSFGYDSSTHDYKLLMGINQRGVDGSLVQLFSLTSMTWTLIGHINYLLVYDLSAVLLNGAFHWFAFDFSINKLVILSFDLSQEEFKPIPMPVDKTYLVPYSRLGIFQDNLCMSCVDDKHFYHGLWVLPNYYNSYSWEFLPNDYEIKSLDAVYYLNIFASTSPTNKRMGFFCHDTPSFSRSLIHTISHPIYVQTLVSPYLNTEIPSHAGSLKVAERECQEMHYFERSTKNKRFKGSEEILWEIMEIYEREGGENEKSYLREDMNKKKSRDLNMSKGKTQIVEILAKEEGESSNGKNKRKSYK